MAKLIYLSILVAVLVVQAQALKRFEEEVKVLRDIFENEKYKDNRVILRPPGDLTNVTVNMMVNRVISICEKTHTMKVQVTLRQEWNDRRLRYTPPNSDYNCLTLDGDFKTEHRIWTPDVYFPDEVECREHDLLKRNTLIRIHPNGNVIFSKRITLDVICPVTDYKRKDFVCPIKISTFARTRDELDLHWKNEKPVQLTKNRMLLDKWRLHRVDTRTCEDITILGDFVCLAADFKFGYLGCEHME